LAGTEGQHLSSQGAEVFLFTAGKNLSMVLLPRCPNRHQRQFALVYRHP